MKAQRVAARIARRQRGGDAREVEVLQGVSEHTTAMDGLPLTPCPKIHFQMKQRSKYKNKAIKITPKNMSLWLHKF